MESAGTLFGTIWRHVPEDGNQNLQRVKCTVLMTVTMNATIEELCPADGDSKLGGIPLTNGCTLHFYCRVLCHSVEIQI
jgi:hypothetical protein